MPRVDSSRKSAPSRRRRAVSGPTRVMRDPCRTSESPEPSSRARTRARSASNVESLTWFAAAVSYTSRPSVASMSERMTRVTRSAGEEPRRGAVRRPAHAARSRRYPAGPDSTITPPEFACAA